MKNFHFLFRELASGGRLDPLNERSNQGCGAGVGVARSRGNEPGVGVVVGADHSCLDSYYGTLIKICGIACLCNLEFASFLDLNPRAGRWKPSAAPKDMP